MESWQFECVWQKGPTRDIIKVKEMWKKYGAIESDDRMESRARQIVFIVKDPEGEVTGVSTVRPIRASFLNNHYFYEFRCFIAPPFRTPGLDSVLALKTKLYMEQLKDSVSRFKGLLMIVENAQLKEQRTKAVWPASGMVFAGYTSKGHHIRVGYFKGARI